MTDRDQNEPPVKRYSLGDGRWVIECENGLLVKYEDHALVVSALRAERDSSAHLALCRAQIINALTQVNDRLKADNERLRGLLKEAHECTGACCDCIRLGGGDLADRIDREMGR